MDAQHDVSSHCKGVRTCVARLSGDVLSERFCNQAVATESGIGSHPKEEVTTPTDGGINLSDGESWAASDDESFSRTPTGSESDFGCPHAESMRTRIDQPRDIAEVTRTPSTISLASALPQTSMRQVMLQVPVDLPPDIECEDLSFSVSNMRVDAKSSGAQVALRLIVRGSRTPSPSAAHVVEHAARCNTGAERAEFCKQTSLSPSWQPPPPPATCCHWKNKGWCKFRESCKFAHPPHKRGVGSTKLPFPPLSQSIQFGRHHA